MDQEHVSERIASVYRVIDDCIERRFAGETLSDDDIVAAHPELLPELADELRNLAVIERARRRVGGSSQISDLDIRLDPEGLGASLAQDVFCGYEIIEELRHGGQGFVYRAVQRSTNQQVALKVIRDGALAGAHARARFEREVHVLGALHHPNIVAVHDSGCTAAGSFYCVMDFVDGPPLDVFVQQMIARGAEQSRRRPPIRPVLDLFLVVCDAVHAAHLRGVIHRDLKPSNIRVGADGRPIVLDFGLAKMADTDPAAEPQGDMTVTGQFVGSVPWASPEQAAGARDVDLRTDIHALGLILYRLLLDRLPYDTSGDARAVLERIIGEPPQRPRAIRPDLDPDIETIILKCLSKDRERRYQSVGELAADIGRYLAGQPIEARRDSTWYVLKKTVRRHRAAVSVTAALVVLLIGASIWLAALYAGQTRERRRAVSAAHRAEAESTKAQATVKVLQKMLETANPHTGGAAEFTMQDMLDNFAATIDQQLAGQPEVEAEVRTTIAKAYIGLGEFEKARDHAAAALRLAEQLHNAPDDKIAQALNDYGLVLMDQGEFVEAENTFHRALDMYTELHGRHCPEYAATLHNLAVLLTRLNRRDEAEPLLQEAVEIGREVFDENDRRMPVFITSLATFASGGGQLEEAGRLYREALDRFRAMYGDENIDVAYAMKGLGGALADLSKFDEAESLQREALAMFRRLLGDDSVYVASALNNLAETLRTKGQYDEAIDLSTQALDIFRHVHGDVHESVALALNNVANMLFNQRRYEEAEPLALESLEISRKLFGEEHYYVAGGLNTLSLIDFELHRYQQGEERLAEALEIFRKLLGDQHPTIIAVLNNLGRFRGARGDYSGALEYYRQALDIARAVYPDDSPATASVMTHIAEALEFEGDYDESENLYRDALAMRRRLFGNEHRSVAFALNGLGDMFIKKGDLDSAEPFYRKSVAISTATMPADSADRSIPLLALGRILVTTDRPADAEPFLRDAYAVVIKVYDSTDAHVGDAEHWLGACLADLGRHDDAELLLLSAYAIRLGDEAAAAEDLVETVSRIRRLYEDWPKPDLAARWRQTESDLLAAS